MTAVQPSVANADLDQNAAAEPARLDVAAVRRDFPVLQQTPHGKRLAYLDNAASSQKPTSVINAVRDFYAEDNANVHRGVYELSQRATDAFEGARSKCQRFLNAASAKEIIFTRGATEAVNLVANSLGAHLGLQEGDEILVTQMEHHSNIVPWQMLCERTGAKLKVAPINDAGELLIDEFAQLLGPKTRLVAAVHISNSLGTINPVKTLVEMAHQHGVPVLLDGAQAVAHQPVDVQDLDCDFYVFSGHKVFGPTGIGALYGKKKWLDAMPPYQGGGEMILSVSFEKTIYARVPQKFEAGTPNIAGAVGLGAAIDYVSDLDWSQLQQHEAELAEYAHEALASVPGLRLVGTAEHKAPVFSFVLDAAHPHDIGTIVDREGVAIRSGHHCTQPIMERYSVPATVRASLAFYNTRDDVDQLVHALHRVREVFS